MRARGAGDYLRIHRDEKLLIISRRQAHCSLVPMGISCLHCCENIVFKSDTYKNSALLFLVPNKVYITRFGKNFSKTEQKYAPFFFVHPRFGDHVFPTQREIPLRVYLDSVGRQQHQRRSAPTCQAGEEFLVLVHEHREQLAQQPNASLPELPEK